jgi:all-trans-retinol 13,14-reductase
VANIQGRKHVLIFIRLFFSIEAKKTPRPQVATEGKMSRLGNAQDTMDAIVIGSGIGGLAVAAILSKLNHKRVLVLEKHFQLGGLTHEFSRGRFKWDVGLHYLGGLGEGELSKKIFDYLTEGKLAWTKMPHVFEKFVYPDHLIEVPSSREEYIGKLIRLFPSEKAATQRYFKDIERTAAWYCSFILSNSLPPFASSLLRFLAAGKQKTALLTVKGYLDSHFGDHRLKAVLASQWGNYGLPPQKASFAMHALIVQHYLSGGYYPVGGAGSIVRYLQPVIESTGGALLAGHEVTDVIVENGAVTGVKTRYQNGKEFEVAEFKAPITISNIGAFETYQRLLGRHLAPPPGMESLPKGLSAVTAYIGLKKSPEALGLKGENFWIYDSYDHDRSAENASAVLDGKPRSCYLSFPSLKNPAARAHTAEILAPIEFERFSSFTNSQWLHREREYYDLKEKMATGLIGLVDRHLKGFKGLVEYVEVSTPLSLEHFTSRSQGLMYGIPSVPERYALPWLSVKTPLKNFFLSGSDIGSPGIVGALMGGITCAAVLNGNLGFFKIIAAVNKDAKKRAHGKTIERPAAPRTHPLAGEVTAKLIGRGHLAGSFYELTFELSGKVQFRPGQHMFIRVGPTEWRPYNIVNVSENKVTFVIDVNPGGPGSQFALNYPVGGWTITRKPGGTFCLEETEAKEKIFIATGCGVTPFISMLEHLASHYQGEKIRMLWGIREENQDFSSRYFAEIQRKIPLEMYICISRPSTPGSFFSGRVNDKLRELAIDYRRSDFYLCGNPGMVSDIHCFLRSAGPQHIFFEM